MCKNCKNQNNYTIYAKKATGLFFVDTVYFTAVLLVAWCNATGKKKKAR